eukprot:1836788-Amphidinium_carterae.1
MAAGLGGDAGGDHSVGKRGLNGRSTTCDGNCASVMPTRADSTPSCHSKPVELRLQSGLQTSRN